MHVLTSEGWKQRERKREKERERNWERQVWGSIHYNGAMCLATSDRLLVRSLPGSVHIRLFRLSAHADDLRLDVSDVISAGNARERSRWRWEPDETMYIQTRERAPISEREDTNQQRR